MITFTGVNSHTGVGYFKTEDTTKPQLFMFCQADPKEYTQGFKMAVQWRNGSMLFVDDGNGFFLLLCIFNCEFIENLHEFLVKDKRRHIFVVIVDIFSY